MKRYNFHFVKLKLNRPSIQEMTGSEQDPYIETIVLPHLANQYRLNSYNFLLIG